MCVLREDLRGYVLSAKEDRNVEYKSELDWSDKAHRAKLIRSIIAMSNLRYGGVIVIGVNNDGTPSTLEESVARTWTHDLLSPTLSRFAAPPVEFAVSSGMLDTNLGPWFVVIEVTEFRDVPTICASDGIDLQAAAIYVRSRRMHETAKVSTEAELRELLDIAVEKGVAQFVRKALGAGLNVEQNDSIEQYQRELGDL